MAGAVTPIELARALAPMLPGWFAIASPASDWGDGKDRAVIERADGAAVSIRIGGWRNEGRVTFLALWPTYRDGRGYSPRERLSITCAVSRTPKAMAADIARRLLPTYLPAHEAARAEVRRSDLAALEAAAVASRIATIVGGSAEPCKGNTDAVAVRGVPESVARLRVLPEYSSSTSTYTRPLRVDFEVHGLDPDTAARVLQLIADADDERPRVAARARVEASRADEGAELDPETEPMSRARVLP